MLDVSVLFTTHNRGHCLGRTLEAFAALQTPGLKWELLAVDNGSTDATPRVLRSYASRLPLRPIEEPQPGKSRALNRALSLARGAILVFTDDDVVPVPTWLSAMAAGMARWPEDHIFAGRIVPLFPPGAPEWLRQHRWAETAFARFMPDMPEGPSDQLPFGPNFAMRAPLLAGQHFSLQLGPVGNSCVMGEDTELAMRFVRAGKRVIFIPDAEVGHIVREEQLHAQWLYRRAFNSGRGMLRVGAMFEKKLPSTRSIYRKLLTSALRYGAAMPFSSRETQARIERGAMFHCWRGSWHEHRRMLREDPRATPRAVFTRSLVSVDSRTVSRIDVADRDR